MLRIDDGYGYVPPAKPPHPTTSSDPAGGTEATTFDQHMQAARGGSGNDANGTAAWSDGDPNYQVVKHGDTLIGISNQDHVPLSTLYGLNREFDPRRQDGILHSDRSPHGGWDPDYIKPGDRIYLPYHRQPKAPPAHPPAKPPVTMPPPAKPQPHPQSKPKDHTAPAPFFKWGVGGETGFKGSKGLSISEEPYFKGSFALNHQWNINFKVKYTPKGKATLKPVDPTAKPDPAKTPLSKWGRFKAGIKPEKISVDVGVVYNKEVEVGGSWEFKSLKPSQLLHPSLYGSSKDPHNVLVNTAQAKGKVPAHKIVDAIKDRNKPIDENDPSKGVRGWKSVGKAAAGTEVQFAAEKGLLPLPESGTLFVNGVAKSTLADSPAFKPTPRWAGVTGFAVGAGSSIVGAKFTDTFAGQYIHNAALRQTVDGLGGVATGIVVNHVTQSVVPKLGKVPLVAKAVKPLATLAKPAVGLLKPIATSKAGRAIGNFLSKEAPTLAQDAKFASKLRFGARVAGPVGAAIAAAPDVISAVNSFAHGKVGAGFTSLADGTIRAGATVAGAAIGQALIPIPGVGAAVGSIVGGIVGDAIVAHQAQIVDAAKDVGKGLATAGKAVGHAAVSAAKSVAHFFGF
jgi:hypothetical protein